MINMNKKELVAMLNNVIEEAIMHGGDSGGPYYSNNKNLMESVRNILTFLEIDDIYKISDLDKYGDYASLEKAIVPKE